MLKTESRFQKVEEQPGRAESRRSWEISAALDLLRSKDLRTQLLPSRETKPTVTRLQERDRLTVSWSQLCGRPLALSYLCPSVTMELCDTPARNLDKFIEDQLLPDTPFRLQVKQAINIICSFLKEKCFQHASHSVRVSKVVKVSPPTRLGSG